MVFILGNPMYRFKMLHFCEMRKCEYVVCEVEIAGAYGVNIDIGIKPRVV